MPFERPTLPVLTERLLAEFEARLPEASPRRRASNLNVLARTLAGALHSLWGFTQWASLQVFPDTAEAEYLDRWAAVWGVPRAPAVAATAVLTVTGAPGAAIPAGTRWQRPDGSSYQNLAEALLGAAGTVAVAIECENPGAAGSLAVGEACALISPLAGVQSSAKVASVGLSGTDRETDASLRTRLISRIQQAPHGGARHDYVNWALEIPGITRAWVKPHWLGEGSVGVFVMRDNDTDSPIPGAAELQAVQDYLDERAPITARPMALAPTAIPLDLTIKLTPDLDSVRRSVLDNLQALVRDAVAPGSTLYVSQIREAISRAAGETSHQLLVPAADITVHSWQILTLGNITWSA